MCNKLDTINKMKITFFEFYLSSSSIKYKIKAFTFTSANYLGHSFLTQIAHNKLCGFYSTIVLG
ncbi:hypothetical protein BpHYR1_030231 [Brachionus plicatilis]|uniref:Uncharacterized protein n=1 Tax=Brachionus plicatilis TaxID=10195 RepID=A0A3M7SKM7_BRAPC|nr:hypothetical protein BpHYR1_030231 [Brachionus plicatilis]